jgi:hypothetical protein
MVAFNAEKDKKGIIKVIRFSNYSKTEGYRVIGFAAAPPAFHHNTRGNDHVAAGLPACRKAGASCPAELSPIS